MHRGVLSVSAPEGPGHCCPEMFRAVHNGCTVLHEVLVSSPETSISDWLKALTPTDPCSARKDQSDHSAGLMITPSAKRGLSYGVRFPKEMPKPSPSFAKLYSFPPTTRALSESSSVSSSVLSVTQAWAPPTQRCLHLFISQGKTTHGFPVAAGPAVVSAVCWALFVCLERDAEEGHCAPLEVGSFATVFKWDWNWNWLLIFAAFSLAIFCFLCCNQTADALACCRADRFRMISAILSKWAKCSFHIQNHVNQ